MPRKKPNEKVEGVFTDILTEPTLGGEAQGLLKESYEHEWRLSAHDIWYFAQFCKTKEEETGLIRDFPCNYDYLHRANKEIEEYQKTAIFKPRRLMITWLGAIRQLHNAFFTNPNVSYGRDIYLGGIGSIGETEALYIMDRISHMYHKLPEWMRLRNPLVVNNKMKMEFLHGGVIQAFPCKREGPQTFGFTEFFFDEMALQEAARTTWMGMVPTLGHTGKLIAVSTPNGKLNFFYRLWTDEEDEFQDVHRIELDWNDHPEHDDNWLRQTTSGMDKQGIARNFFKSFAAYSGSPVWSKFDHNTHVIKAEDVVIFEDRPMILGWDFGFHFPACLWMQINPKDQWQIIAERQGYDIDFGVFTEECKAFANTFYDRRDMREIHFIDPAGMQRYASRAQSGASCDADQIRIAFKQKWGRCQIRPGAVQVGTRENEGVRLKSVRKLWNLRDDGRPGVLISDACTDFIEGCGGGYAYPETGGEVPLKNEASHLQDCFQMGVTGHNAHILGTKQTKKDFVHMNKPRRKRIGWRTGL